MAISTMGPQSGLGGGPPEPEPPKAPIPDVNVPPTALRFSPQLTTDEAGKAVVTIATSNPGTPRGYLDGQIYMLQYQLNGQAPEQQQQLDLILLLLYDAYAIPDQPTWVEHIQPIFQQYGNLYPIMSQRLINLGDYQAVRDHRALLELAFSLDEHDPNAMPVTRDLSRPKQATILTWLRQTRPDGSYALVYGDVGAMPAARHVAAVSHGPLFHQTRL